MKRCQRSAFPGHSFLVADAPREGGVAERFNRHRMTFTLPWEGREKRAWAGGINDAVPLAGLRLLRPHPTLPPAGQFPLRQSGIRFQCVMRLVDTLDANPTPSDQQLTESSSQ